MAGYPTTENDPDRIVCVTYGRNTGDCVLVTEDGTRWLLVAYFPLNRATGAERGLTDFRRVYRM